MKALIPIPICETCGRPCKRSLAQEGCPGAVLCRGVRAAATAGGERPAWRGWSS
jgi:hypothetical protein